MAAELGKFLSEQLEALPKNNPHRNFLEAMLQMTNAYLWKPTMDTIQPELHRGARRGDGINIDGQMLKTIRLENNFTQSQLAEAGEVTIGYISRVEKGSWTRVSLRLAKTIADMLEVTVEDLTLKPDA